MGMVLEHELAACYAAGSLGGTLGRLNESLRRLSRARCTGSREKPGGAADTGFIEPAKVTLLNQTLRLMADAWQSRNTAWRQLDHLEDQLDHLKEKALEILGAGPGRLANRHSEYQLLAQALDNLKAEDRHWV